MTVKLYLHRLMQITSIEALWDAHVSQMARYGFDRLLYGYTRFRTETSLGDPNDFTILSNHDPNYINGYMTEGRFTDAPMLKWALENDGSTSWRLAQNMAAKGQLSVKQQAVFDYNQRMGVHAGYTVSFNSASPRCKGMIALTARQDLTQDDVDEIWKEHGADISLMNNVAHLKIVTLPYSAPNRSLTNRQREVLQWVGDGKTTQDIAVVMGLTVATVEKHLRLARQTLCVETTAQAVLKASLHNQMFVSDQKF